MLGRHASALDIVSLLESGNGKLLVNLSPEGVGHVLTEFENFMCMKALGEVDPNGFHIYMGPVNERTSAMAEMYGTSLCSAYIMANYAPEMARSIALFRPDLTVDVGLSASKIVPLEGKTIRFTEMAEGYLQYYARPEELEIDTANYFRRRKSLAGNLPLRRQFEMSSELSSFINLDGRKLAVISHKDRNISTSNHTGMAGTTDLHTYVPAMEYLRDAGYRLVHAGREPFPDLYSDFDVVDYANSPLASFKNDLVLFSNVDFGLFNPSGIANFAEIFGVPFVIASIWGLNFPSQSANCVFVPALARSRETGEIANFKRQLSFRKSKVYFPKDKYEPINCDGDDILAAVIEALELSNNDCELNDLQNRFRELSVVHPCPPHAQSRISKAFIKRHSNLL